MPPGQRARASFPRFGVPFVFRPLAGPGPSTVRIRGAVTTELELPVARLRELPRRSLVADFHCVTGWSVESLRWGGVPFRALYSEVIEAEAAPRPGVSHVVFRGADGYRATLTLDDALGEDVLLADELGDRPLGLDHGAPVRLLSPDQYAYMSTKHVSASSCTRPSPRAGTHGGCAGWRKGCSRRIRAPGCGRRSGTGACRAAASGFRTGA